MIGLLTGIIGKVAKGAAAKAIASQYSGALTTGTTAAIAVFGDGLAAGALPQIKQIGVVVGAAVAGGVLNRVTTWIAPANDASEPAAPINVRDVFVLAVVALVGGVWLLT